MADDPADAGPSSDQASNDADFPTFNGVLTSFDAQPISYPFLRALHSFDSTTLSSNAQDPENDPANICLSFQESEIILLHTIHSSGWGDATILSSGVRGWIPTNYFTPYTDAKMTALLSAVLGFVLNPKSQPLAAPDSFSFSQSSITGIVAGVRALLESCGALTRDMSIIKKSQAIRKFRKILLAELAILVSLAKQYRNTTDDANIERLVNESFKVVSRAVVFLDIWTIDTSSTGETETETEWEPATTLASSSNTDLAESLTEVDVPIAEEKVYPRTKPTAANRESVIFHGQPPYVRQRLDEVNEALTSYLGNFLHRMTYLDSDASASMQILVNTRKSMLACRELLSAVEAISSRSLPRNRDLEVCKDKLFAQIRTLVTAARDVVASAPTGEDLGENAEDSKGINKPVPPLPSATSEKDRLIGIAMDCAKTSGECVVRCRHIIEKTGDFQLPAGREYPDFSNGVIAASRKMSSIVVVDEADESKRLSHLSVFTPITKTEGTGLALQDQVILDENGRVRGGSLEGLVKVLTGENVDMNFLSTFFLTFRQFTDPLELVEVFIRAYTADDSADARRRVYKMLKLWMESYWKHSADVVVLPQIVNFANAHLTGDDLAAVNALAEKYQRDPRPTPLLRPPLQGSLATQEAAVAYMQTPVLATQVSKTLAAALAKAVETQPVASNGSSGNDDETKSWSSSLRMVKATNPLASVASVVGSPVTLLDILPFDLAKQLTLMDNQAYCQIQPEELLDLNFSAKRKHLGLAPNVNEMTVMANRLAAYVGDSILSGNVAVVKTRKNVLKHWLKVADKLLLLRNFNSLMTIMSALQSVNILRLRRTWEVLSPKYTARFQELKQTVSMDKNYAGLRQLVREMEVPTVPYIGVYLTDLTFIAEGNSTHRLLVVGPDGSVLPPGRAPSEVSEPAKEQHMVINFDRHDRTAKVVGEVQAFQVQYRLQRSGELQTWLAHETGRAHAHVARDRNNLWRRSCILEPNR